MKKLPITVSEITDEHVMIALAGLTDTHPLVRPRPVPHPMAERLLMLLWAERCGIEATKTKLGVAVGSEHLEIVR